MIAHERGPKLRIVKFKPKRGYKRRNGHRQELTRIEVTSLGRRVGRRPSRRRHVGSGPPLRPAGQPATEEATDGS